MKQQLLVDPAARQDVLAAERNRKMAASAHAYVRGSTARFYRWLAASDRAPLPEGPPVWICGDCHAGNLGPVASTRGALEIQVRDLDQTVIGNPAHDLIRLALSLAMAARGSDLPGVTTAHIVEHMMEGYEAAFSGADEPESVPKTVNALLRTAAGRSWKHLADERIEGVEPVIPLGPRFWPLSDQETTGLARNEEAEVSYADLHLRSAGWRRTSLGRSPATVNVVSVVAGLGAGRCASSCLLT